MWPSGGLLKLVSKTDSQVCWVCQFPLSHWNQGVGPAIGWTVCYREKTAWTLTFYTVNILCTGWFWYIQLWKTPCPRPLVYLWGCTTRWKRVGKVRIKILQIQWSILFQMRNTLFWFLWRPTIKYWKFFH